MPTPTSRSAVAANASGRNSSTSPSSPGATTKLSGSPTSGPAMSTARARSGRPARPAGGRHQSHPTSSIICSASSRFSPAPSTSIGSRLKRAELGDLVGGRHVGVGGELEVVVRRTALLRRLGEVADQLDRLGALVGALDHAEARQVHVRAAPVLVGPHRRHRELAGPPPARGRGSRSSSGRRRSRPSLIASSTSVSEPRISGSLAIQRRSIASVASAPSFAIRSATNETL